MKKMLFVVILLAFSIGQYAFARSPEEGYPMGPWMMWGYGMGWFWPIIMIAFWIAVIVGIIFLIRWLVISTDKTRGLKSEESALEILKKRYARGEIDREEFEAKKKDLTGYEKNI